MDKRRFGVIEVRRINASTYWLEIAGTMWSEVEWSAKRNRWCIQDGAGMCLAHEESIMGQNKDPQAAIRRAKRMIVDGSMPSPEEAFRLHEERQSGVPSGTVEAGDLGQPMPILKEREKVK